MDPDPADVTIGRPARWDDVWAADRVQSVAGDLIELEPDPKYRKKYAAHRRGRGEPR